MEDIEKLKQDNETLNARLKKAVEVFKEQKANIENLTKENEELKNKIKDASIFEANSINKVVPELEEKLKGYENEFKSLNAINDDLNKQLDNYELKIQNLENTIISKDTAYKTLQNTYNEVFGENVNLKKDLDEHKKLNDDIVKAKEKLETELKELKEHYSAELYNVDNARNEIDSLTEDYNNLKKDHENLKNEKENLIKDYQKQLEDLKHKMQLSATNEINVEKEKANQKIKELEEKNKKDVEELTVELKKSDESYKEIESKYNELRTIINNVHTSVSGYSAEKYAAPKQNIMQNRMGSDKEFGQGVGV